MEKQYFYLTTPIYYPNAAPHIGTAYTTIATDCLARFHRLLGQKVHFLTGTDEHGQKMEKAAQEKGLPPKEFVEEMVKLYQNVWQKLNISNDDFIRTTQPRHTGTVKKIFTSLQEKGYIYKHDYEGWYCVSDETFWLPSQLKAGKCPNPECQRPVEWLKEEGYFFKLSAFQEKLLDYLKEHPAFVQPLSRYNETVSFIKRGLQDICVSRKGLQWGIPVPGDEEYAVYVWIDALSNYITAVGYLQEENFSRFWPADLQMVGKDILRFHTVIWPAILMALELPLPRMIFSHGWIVMGGDKVSKSRGAKSLSQLLDAFSPDALRYFLLKQAPFGQDLEFSEEALADRYNNELANDLGNLLHRSLAMLVKYFKGEIPPPGESLPPDQKLLELIAKQQELFKQHLNAPAFREALSALWEIVVALNGYVEKSAPWTLAKSENKERLSTVLYHLSEGIRQVVIMVYPFIPASAQAMWQQLGFEGEISGCSWKDLKAKPLSPGQKVNRAVPVFPKIELEETVS